ncbi:centromere protein O [Ictalurus furcatus]|uniref:centromere protein O n=1 Tax=Ictalurus furcatus TaxID=66913 RepID=UPI002350CA35|nr:centromere protein O [Ictalurus furcatus]
MDNPRQKGVFDHLMMLERREAAVLQRHQNERLEELRTTAATLRAKKDRIRVETSAIKNLKAQMDQGLPLDDDETEHFVKFEPYLLMSRRMQLRDLQTAHRLIAGYDLIESKQGKSVCVSFHTAFEGVCLETYNMEMDLNRMVQISRHNIPPCIPLEKLAKENLQTDFKGFLQTLDLHLNALAGRKQQITLVKELVGTVEIIEKNQLCNFLALVCKAPAESDEDILCTLEYGDLTRCLPTHVVIDGENKTLIESPQWKEHQVLLLETPVHSALLTMRKLGSIS